MSPIAGSLLVDEIIPRLQNSIPMSVSRFGSEDIEELVQDGTVMAAQILISAESKGKSVSAGNVVFYTIRLLQSGRRSTGTRMRWRTSAQSWRADRQLRRLAACKSKSRDCEPIAPHAMS